MGLLLKYSMSNYLITGVSSGIGRELTKRLVSDGHRVIGIARRKKLLLDLHKDLKNNPKFSFVNIDLSVKNAWKDICKYVNTKDRIPDVVIFNAAIFEKDYQDKELDFFITRKLFEINFFSVIKGFEEIIKIAPKNTQFIFISSSSALKGSGAEGIGYPASKAALSIAFESLYQKYKLLYQLKIIYLGPVNTDMSPFRSLLAPILSKSQAVEKIIKVIQAKKVINFLPWHIFSFLRLIKIFPDFIYLTIISFIDILHLKSTQK